MRVNGVAARSVRAASSAAWVLRGDRGLTYAAVPPQGSVLTQGQWWNKDYRGPPLLSISEDIAGRLGFGAGRYIKRQCFGASVEGGHRQHQENKLGGRRDQFRADFFRRVRCNLRRMVF